MATRTTYGSFTVPAMPDSGHPGDSAHFEYSLEYFNSGNHKWCTLGIAEYNHCSARHDAMCDSCLFCDRPDSHKVEMFAKYAMELGYKITREGYTGLKALNSSPEILRMEK